MNLTELSLRDGSAAAEQAEEAAAALRQYLQAHPARPARLRLGDGPEGEKQILIPAAAFAVFAAMLGELARGQTITVAPAHAELTTQQAADLLNVSRPYLIKLLDKQEIPHRRVGNRRKVSFEDLLDYKRRDDERRQAILDELTAEAQDLGLYD
jgi:excisionase family DNA binding protein